MFERSHLIPSKIIQGKQWRIKHGDIEGISEDDRAGREVEIRDLATNKKQPENESAIFLAPSQ